MVFKWSDFAQGFMDGAGMYSRAIKQVFILLAKLVKDRVQSLIYPVRGVTRKTRPGAEAGQDMLRLTWLPCLNNDIQNKV